MFFDLYDKNTSEMNTKTQSGVPCLNEVKLHESFRKFSETFEVDISLDFKRPTRKFEVRCFRNHKMLTQKPRVTDSFRDVVQGPFTFIGLNPCVLNSLSPTEFQDLIYSPIIINLCIYSLKESTKAVKDLFYLADDSNPSKSPFPALTHLSLTFDNNLTTSKKLKINDEDLSLLFESPIIQNIMSLNLARNNISNVGLSIMTQDVTKFKNLTQLNLEANTFDHDGILDLLKGGFIRKLVSLNLSGKRKYMRLEDKTAKSLADCLHFQELKSLSIHTQLITDEGIRALALSPNFPELLYLNVNNLFFSNKGALAFSKASGDEVNPLPKLSHLVLTSWDSIEARMNLGREQISEETKQEIQKAHPDLKID